MTSPDHFYFVFVPRIASNRKKVKFGEVVVPKRFLRFAVKFIEKS
jgi:hypothetical protein